MNNIDEDIKMAKSLIKILDKTCENNNSESSRMLERILSELETYKKIANMFGKTLIYISNKDITIKELLDWARKEVTNDK